MMKNQTFCIRPTGHESGPETEVFQLSNIDYLAPPFYTMLSLCYQLEEEQDRQAIVDNLKNSLQITVDQYRIVAATVKTEPGTGEISAVRKRDGGTKFNVNVMDKEAEFPDFATLDQAGFAFKMMSVDKLFPEEVSKRMLNLFQEFPDPPAMVVQANFIRGGLILCVASHHRISDGTGTNHFVGHWAANARALSTGTACPPFDKAILDRAPLCYRGKQPSDQRMIQLREKIGFVRHAEESDKPQASEEPITLITLHFSQSRLAALKADASPSQASGYPENTETAHPNGFDDAKVPWISTYDAIVAVVWRALTRARMPAFECRPSGLPATSSQMHAVNLRRVAGLPESFYGNALALPMQTLPLSTLTSSPDGSPDPNLAVVAASVRAGIKRCSTRETIDATAEWIAGTENKGLITLPNLFGTGLLCTSWRSMTYYDVADFGFGRPNRVRRPPIVQDGVMFAYPRRPQECGAGPDEGNDAVIALIKPTAERLLEDEELLQYAKVVNVE